MSPSFRRLLVAGALWSSAAAAQSARIAVDRSVLPNGLTLQLVEDHSTQVVSVSLWYDVGSRDEVPGKTGFAHLFEHMMFQGSAHIAKAEHGQLVERAGGSLNANTPLWRQSFGSSVRMRWILRTKSESATR